jgi:hypothetical protein
MLLKQKTFWIFIFTFLISTSFYGLGSGVQATITPEATFSSNPFLMSYELSGTYRFDKNPVIIGAGLNSFFDNDFYLGASCFVDYLLINKQIHNTLNFYSGIGLKGDFSTNFKQSYFIKGGIPVLFGFSKLFYDGYLELYADQAIKPTFNYIIKPFRTSYNFSLGFPFTFGIRFHF